MSAFEFVFSLFGLLLGLSLVEVLAGLVRTVKARKAVRLGWLTPLLGIFVMLHLTSFWGTAWRLRDHIPATNAALFTGVILAGLYYFAASMVFPERPEEWSDLDEHYFQNKRQVFLGILSCEAIISFISEVLVPTAGTRDFLLGFLFMLVCFAIPVLVKGKRLNLIVLGLLISLYIFSALRGA